MRVAVLGPPAALPADERARSAYLSTSDADRARGLEHAATVHPGDTTLVLFDDRGGVVGYLEVYGTVLDGC